MRAITRVGLAPRRGKSGRVRISRGSRDWLILPPPLWNSRLRPVLRDMRSPVIAAVLTLLACAHPAAAQPTSFNPLVNVSNTAGQPSNLADITVDGATTYVAWREQTATAQQIRLRRSTNGGVSFIDGTSGGLVTAIDPAETVFAIRVSAAGSMVYVLYTSGIEPRLAKARLARSQDGGATFAAPVTLAEGPELGGSAYADLAVDGTGAVHVVLESRDADEDILRLSSIDQGMTFSAPLPLAASPATASRRPRVAAAGAQLAVVWEEGTDIAFIHSLDAGASFGDVRNVSASEATSTTPDVAISNAIHVVWTEGNSVALQTSLDGIAFTATQPVAIAPAGRRLAGAVVASAVDTVHVSWITMDNDGVMEGPFYRRSTDGAATFAPIRDLRLGGPGRPFGPPAVVNSIVARIAWPHSPSGFEPEADVYAAVEPNCAITWQAAVSGNWNDATKWSPPVIPVAGSSVCITADGAPYTVTVQGVQNAGELTIGHATSAERVTLRVTGALTIGTSLVTSGDVTFGAGGQITSATGLVTITERGRLITQTGAPATLHASAVNYGGVDLSARLTIPTAAGRSFSNFGTFTTHAGGMPAFGGGFVFNQNAGVLKVDGGMELSAEFGTAGDTLNFNGGDVDGTVIIQGHSRLNIGPGSVGRGTFQFERNVIFSVSNGGHLSGSIAPLQTIRLLGTIAGNTPGVAFAHVAAGVANAGTIEMTATAANAGGATIAISGTMINTGRIVATRPGDTAAGRIEGALDNRGTLDLDDDVTFGSNGSLTNTGTVNVGADASIVFGSDYVVNQNGGVLRNAGRVEMSAEFSTAGDTFNFNDGTVEGAVVIQGHSRLNIGPGSVGAGTFVFERNVAFGFSSGGSLSGNIAAAQTVRIRGTPGAPTPGTGHAIAAAGFTNFGTLILESTAATAGGATLVVNAGTFINRGSLMVNDIGPGKVLRGHSENRGTMTVLTPLSLQLPNGTFNNFGDLTVGPAGKITLGQAAVVTQHAGTMTLDGPIELATEFSTAPDLFTFVGGNIVGTAGVHLMSTSRLSIAASAAAGAGRFVYRVRGNTGGGTLTGNIGPQMTLRLQGNNVTSASGLTNAGTIVITQEAANTTATLNVTTGVLVNTGTITVEPTAAGAPINAVVENHGRITINDSIQFNRPNVTHVNDGIMEIAQGQTLTLAGNGTFRNTLPGGIAGTGTLTIANGSTFIGAGNFGVNVVNGGRFRPGASPGIVNISGRFTQTSTGRLEIEIGGSSPGSGFDQINVGDLATLAGTLEVQIAAGFCIEGGYPILTYPSVTGDFATRLGLTGAGGRSLTPSKGATAYALNTTGPPCNQGPVAAPDGYGTEQGVALNVAAPGVLGNDTDAQGDTLTALLVSGPANGTLAFNANGSFTYTPNAGFSGVDGFTYKATDGAAQSGVTAVTISVTSAALPTITALTPDALMVGHVRTLTITGANFSTPAVTLKKGDLEIAGNVISSTPATIDAEFDLTDVPPGEWTLVVGVHNGRTTSAPLFIDAAISFPGFAWDGVQGFPVLPEPRLNRRANYLTVFNLGVEDGMMLVTLELPHPAMRLRVGTAQSPLHTGGTVQVFVWVPKATPVRVPLYWGISPEHVNFPGMPADPAKVNFGELLSFRARGTMGLTAGSGVVTKLLVQLIKTGCNDIRIRLAGHRLEEAADEVTKEMKNAKPGTVSLDTVLKKVADKLLDKALEDIPGVDIAKEIADCTQDVGKALVESWEQEIQDLSARYCQNPRAAQRALDRLQRGETNLRSAISIRQSTIDWLGDLAQGECDPPPDFDVEFLGRVRAGWDPNNKATNSALFCQVGTVNGTEQCAPHFIGPEQGTDSIEYVIEFENKPEATGPAENVVITDVIDDDLDPSTLQVLHTSHPSTAAQPNRFSYDVSGNVVTFRFTGIDLPPNVESPDGEGDVTFTIRPRPGLASGAEITNSASIVFDFNPPIVTPEVVHVVDTAPPVTTASPSVEPNAHGWNRTDVTITLQADDGTNGSGVKHMSVRVNDGPEQVIAGGHITVPLTHEGAHTIRYFSIDNVGNAEVERTLTVRIDKTAPVVVGARQTAANAFGWNNGPVIVSFTATDALSGIAGSAAAEVTLGAEGANQAATMPFTDLAGNSAAATVDGINIDLTPPTIAGAADRAPNQHGWYNAAVTVTFTCDDALSGIDTCGPDATVIGEEGADLSRTGVATDRAGNIAQASVGSINIDRTAPAVTCSNSAPTLWPPNRKLVAVQATVTVTDALSGAAGFTLTQATSNEPDNGLGDGDTAGDIQGFAVGTADASGQLRAERSGNGTGRIYSLAYAGADLAGNTAPCTTGATVPHSMGAGRK